MRINTLTHAFTFLLPPSLSFYHIFLQKKKKQRKEDENITSWNLISKEWFYIPQGLALCG